MDFEVQVYGCNLESIHQYRFFVIQVNCNFSGLTVITTYNYAAHFYFNT